MLKKQFFSTVLPLALLLLQTPSVEASTLDPVAKVDSLLQLFDISKGETRVQVGQEVLSFCTQQAIFFDEPPTIDGEMSVQQQNLHVWFAAERYLTTTSYYKEALPIIERALGEGAFGEGTTKATGAAGATGNNGGNGSNGIHETLLCDKAYCLFKTSDYTHAVEAGQEAMRLCLQTGNTMQLSRAYLYLSLVNHALRKYDEAKTLVVKAIETNEQMGDNMQLHNALGIACEIFCSAMEIDQAIEYGKRAVEAARVIDYLPGVANHMTQLSYAYDRKGDYALGLQMADSAIAIVKAQEPIDRNQLALTLEYKSWNLIDIGRNAEAVEALREAIHLEEEVGNTHAAWYDYRTLAEAMAPIDARGALDVLNRYVRMSDTIHAQQLKELMSQANAEFHNDELQEANALSRRMNRIIIATSLVILLLLAAVIASLWFAFRQKKRTADTLRRLTEVRENFFTDVTHEFRTPLTVILGLSQELKEKGVKEGEAIERQGTRLLELVNQLLDISKVKSAIVPQPHTQGDLAAYVAMIVEAQREVARQKNVTIDYAAAPESVPASFTPDYVEKVVGNLLSNAIKFTSSGGRVSIDLQVQDHQLRLTVTDTGRGIDSRDLPHIFEPFYQAENADGQGSGVGLALVHQIVETLGGKIDVESQVGEGTKFIVRLPYQVASDIQSVPSNQNIENNPINQIPFDSSQRFPSILIVEDEPDVARLISEQLGNRYTFHFASDGEEGVQKARSLVPDLVITDVMMPRTDGIQLCRTLREDSVTNHIPLIVITAKATEEDRIIGLEAGADAYLYKPFNAEELRVRIEKLLAMRELLRKKYSIKSSNVEQLENAALKKANHRVGQTSLPAMPEEGAAFATQSNDFMQHVRETIIRMIPEGPCTVEGIADQLYISPSQLRRKMNAITGMPPKKYIMMVRMDVAREMLKKHPDMKLSTIAEQCGFYDLSHFTRFYKETYGVTPAADRSK